MAITLTNSDTGQVWVLPNSVSAAGTLYLGFPPYPQGDYVIANGSGATLTTRHVITASVPAGATKSVSTKHGMYSWIPVAVDYAVWNSAKRGNNGVSG